MSLRNQALQQGMLEVLRVDQVEVRVLVPRSKEGSKAGDFIEVVAEVVNRSGELPTSASDPWLTMQASG